MIIKISKNDANLVLQCEEHETPVIYNCKDKTITSFTGRIVKRLPVCANQTRDRKIQFVMNTLHNFTYVNFTVIEPFIPYLEQLNVDDCPRSCPRGYIKWAINNNKELSSRTLEEFLLEKKVKDMRPQDIKILNLFNENLINYRFNIQTYSREELIVLAKIFRVSSKKFYFNFQSVFYTFADVIKDFGKNWIVKVNTERDVIFNTELLKGLLDEEKNKKIRATQEKITFLDGVTIQDEYIIKIPFCIADLEDEGKQQHNCVGHYYNESIARGENMIYFIRKKNEPEKSYITCRYNVRSKSTCEYRYFCNNVISSNSYDYSVIKAITTMINENLY